jgi:hypothetical protein
MPDEEVPRRTVCWGPRENGDWLGHAAQARAASTITLRVDSLVTDEAPEPRPYEELAGCVRRWPEPSEKCGPQTWERWQPRAGLLARAARPVTVYFEWRGGELQSAVATRQPYGKAAGVD